MFLIFQIYFVVLYVVNVCVLFKMSMRKSRDIRVSRNVAARVARTSTSPHEALKISRKSKELRRTSLRIHGSNISVTTGSFIFVYCLVAIS